MVTTLREDLRTLTKEAGEAVTAAFLSAIADVKAQANISAIERHLRSGNIEAVIRELNLTEAYFGPLMKSLEDVNRLGYESIEKAMPKKIGFRFNAIATGAADRVRAQGARLIQNLTTEQQDLVRNVLSQGLLEGRNPRSVALNLVGRMENGTRRGGLIGLSNDLAEHAQNARLDLSTNKGLRNYLGRTLRDQRYDPTVIKALDNGRVLTREYQDILARRYDDSLLRHRGERVARTEANSAVNGARWDAMSQARSEGKVQDDQIIKIWKSAYDPRTRDAHAALHNASVRGLDTPFNSPTGARLKHPGDGSLGAGGADLVNCRCTTEIRLDL